MTPAKRERAKKIKEMADLVTIRNHLFSMVNTGKVSKDKKTKTLEIIENIDQEVLNTSLLELDKSTLKPPAHNTDIVKAREQVQKDREKAVEQTKKAEEQENKSKGVGLIRRVE